MRDKLLSTEPVGMQHVCSEGLQNVVAKCVVLQLICDSKVFPDPNVSSQHVPHSSSQSLSRLHIASNILQATDAEVERPSLQAAGQSHAGSDAPKCGRGRTTTAAARALWVPWRGFK